MKPKITVVGSSNTDLIVKVPRLPKSGETVLGGRFSTAPGGKGANQAVAAARAGGEVTFIAKVGRDVFGRDALQGYVRDGIRAEHISKDPGAPSGIALILVDDEGENSIAVASGANAELSTADIALAKEAIVSASVLLLQLEIPITTVEAAASLAAEVGVRIILNPAPACPLDEKFLKTVSIITPNETEVELLTGVKISDGASLTKAAEKLLRRGVETVIITLGARGAFLADNSEEHFLPSFSVKAIDTTAAGDVFNGVLAVAVAEGLGLPEAVRLANAAAAISVTKLGAQPSAPLRSEIEAFLSRHTS
jgi:ribokinase